LDQLEAAQVAEDNGNRSAALQWLDSAVERVFGVASEEYNQFDAMFNSEGQLWAKRAQQPAF